MYLKTLIFSVLLLTTTLAVGNTVELKEPFGD